MAARLGRRHGCSFRICSFLSRRHRRTICKWDHERQVLTCRQEDRDKCVWTSGHICAYQCSLSALSASHNTGDHCPLAAAVTTPTQHDEQPSHSDSHDTADATAVACSSNPPKTATGSVVDLLLLCMVEASKTTPVLPQSPQGFAILAPQQASAAWFTDRPVMLRDKQMSPATTRDLMYYVSKSRLLV